MMLNLLKLYTLFLILLMNLPCRSFAQNDKSSKDLRLKIGVGYLHSFTIDGHIRVREFDLRGDALEWEQLGLHHFSNPEVWGGMEFKGKHQLNLSYQRIYFQGSNKIDRTIAFNGTLIDGSSGIDLSPSTYQRIRLEYRRLVNENNSLALWLIGGFVYDYFTIYLDGEISPQSERAEVYEQFERQALPYPYFGLSGIYAIDDRSSFQLTGWGSYTPKFNSFFHEGGDVALQYKSFNADLDYSRFYGKFELKFGVSYRSMYLLGDSNEDTNEFGLSCVGPNLRLIYTLK